MKLKDTYNELSGKIVKNSELKQKTDALGIEDTPQMSKSKMMEALKGGYLYELKEVIESIENGMYLSSKGVEELEKAAMAVQHPLFLESAIKGVLSKLADELYENVQPIVQVSAFASDNISATEAFAAAAKECTDYRTNVGKDIHPLSQAIETVAEKVSKKFEM